MRRVVLDANVLVSGIPAGEGTLAELVTLWRNGRFILITSEHILGEVERAWNRPYWLRRFPHDGARRALDALRAQAEIVEVSVDIRGVAGHPQDDLVLATAVSGEASILVTGDKQLASLGSYGGIELLSPRDFLDQLHAG